MKERCSVGRDQVEFSYAKRCVDVGRFLMNVNFIFQAIY